MLNKDKVLEEDINRDYQNDEEDCYRQIVRGIEKAREGIGILTIKEIAKAISYGIKSDLPYLIKELKKYQTKWKSK